MFMGNDKKERVIKYGYILLAFCQSYFWKSRSCFFDEFDVFFLSGLDEFGDFLTRVENFR